MEKLQQSVVSLESEAELLRSQLHAVHQEKLVHAQEVSDLQRKLQDAQSKVSPERANWWLEVENVSLRGPDGGKTGPPPSL